MEPRCPVLCPCQLFYSQWSCVWYWFCFQTRIQICLETHDEDKCGQHVTRVFKKHLYILPWGSVHINMISVTRQTVPVSYWYHFNIFFWKWVPTDPVRSTLRTLLMCLFASEPPIEEIVWRFWKGFCFLAEPVGQTKEMCPVCFHSLGYRLSYPHACTSFDMQIWQWY